VCEEASGEDLCAGEGEEGEVCDGEGVAPVVVGRLPVPTPHLGRLGFTVETLHYPPVQRGSLTMSRKRPRECLSIRHRAIMPSSENME
jgi:hypothetical protein